MLPNSRHCMEWEPRLVSRVRSVCLYAATRGKLSLFWNGHTAFGICHALRRVCTMIPAFGLNGVLPPFVGVTPADTRGVSPYRTTMTEIAKVLATSPERVKLCKGLLAHRRALRDLGVTTGVQWIDGSFCENVEAALGRAPGDIDVVTLMRRPPAHESGPAWQSLVTQNLRVFDRVATKHHYSCDAFFVDLHQPTAAIVQQVTYWFGLFTHQKATRLWKGILQVPIVSDDDAADALLNTSPGPLLHIP